MTTYTWKADAGIYPREALLKAAYAFTDRFYLHLAEEEGRFCIEITSKDGTELPKELGREFENELLSQTVRYQIYRRTHVLREILMARAMASTMVMQEDPLELAGQQQEESAEEAESLANILEDWFSHGEQNKRDL